MIALEQEEPAWCKLMVTTSKASRPVSAIIDTGAQPNMYKQENV